MRRRCSQRVTVTAETVLVEVAGPDALSYLDSQCTQDLSGLAVRARLETLLLAPSGDLVTVARVTRTEPERLELEIPVGTSDATIARLERFAIRAKVDVASSADEPADPWLATVGARIAEQIPGAAELARNLVPHALSQTLRERTVSFTKGCYPGQELVARMQSRNATPPYVLRRCELDGAAQVGAVVGDPSKDGALTSVVCDEATSTWRALAVLHRRDAEGDSVIVHGSGATLARFS
jgi:tRNA-modifying protein YgfZ